MKKSCISISLLLVVNSAWAETVELKFRNSMQQDIVPEENIVDGEWAVVGSSHQRGAHVWRNPTGGPNGEPSYIFKAESNKVNRIEFSEAFGTAKEYQGVPQEKIQKILAAKDGYMVKDVGQYGDTVTYSWSTRFPETLNSKDKGIIAQWHGRPDRTLIEQNGEFRYLTFDEFHEFSQNHKIVKGGAAMDNKTKQKTDMFTEGSAGGPIAALRVGDGYVHLLVRSDSSRRSTNKVKVKPKVTMPIGKVITKGNKQGAMVWKAPISEFPANKWYDFKVEIKYSEYSHTADTVTEPGHVVIWLDGKKVADWKGDVGKNDILGPYFKFGIYKPDADGITVEHSNYQRSIARTRKAPIVELH